MKFFISIFLVFSGLIAFAKEQKRDVATAKFGSGTHHIVMGMPVRPDAACRRAATMAAVKEALDDVQNQTDCQTEQLTMKKEYLEYSVKVNCDGGNSDDKDDVIFNYNVKTKNYKSLSKGCKVVKIEELVD